MQLENATNKLRRFKNVTLRRQDASNLALPDESFDNVVMFFLLHELPAEVRAAAIEEAIRVTRKGGKLVFVDYHKPGLWHPFRYLIQGVFRLLEPFAEDF